MQDFCIILCMYFLFVVCLLDHVIGEGSRTCKTIDPHEVVGTSHGHGEATGTSQSAPHEVPTLDVHKQVVNNNQVTQSAERVQLNLQTDLIHVYASRNKDFMQLIRDQTKYTTELYQAHTELVEMMRRL